MLFDSDEQLRALQRAAARGVKGAPSIPLSPEEQRREVMEAEREMREHQRWRQFAFLLIIVPCLVALAIGIGLWILRAMT